MYKSFTLVILSLARVDISGTDNPNVIPEVNIVTLVEKMSRVLILAIGKGENVSKAGSNVMIVVAAAEAALLISVVLSIASLNSRAQDWGSKKPMP